VIMPKKTSKNKITATELSKILGISIGRVSQLIDEKKLSEPIDLYKSVIEFIAYQKSLTVSTDDKDRLQKARADLLELEVERKNLELVPTYLAQTAVDNMCNVLRKTIDAIPNALSPKLINVSTIPEAKEILQIGIDNVLKELVNPDLYDTANVLLTEENKRRAKHTSK